MSQNVKNADLNELWRALAVLKQFGVDPTACWGDIQITRARWGVTIQAPQRLSRRVVDVVGLDAAVQVLLRWARPTTPQGVLLPMRPDEVVLTLPGDPEVPGGVEWLRLIQKLSDAPEVVRFTQWLSFLGALGEDWRQASAWGLLRAWRTGCFQRERDVLNWAFVWLEGSARVGPVPSGVATYGVDAPLCALCMGWPKHCADLTGRDPTSWRKMRLAAWGGAGIWLQTTLSARVGLRAVEAPLEAPAPSSRPPASAPPAPPPTVATQPAHVALVVPPTRLKPRRGPTPAAPRLTESDTWAVRVLMCTTTPQHLWNKIGALDPVDIQVVADSASAYRVLVPDLTVWSRVQSRIVCDHPDALRAYRKIAASGECTLLPRGVDSLVVLVAHQRTSPVEVA